MREEALSDRLGALLTDIEVPQQVARSIVESLQGEVRQAETQRQERLKGLRYRDSATVRSRMDKLYEDKLDGKIDEDFWSRKQAMLREQELTLEQLEFPVGMYQ